MTFGYSGFEVQFHSQNIANRERTMKRLGHLCASCDAGEKNRKKKREGRDQKNEK